MTFTLNGHQGDDSNEYAKEYYRSMIHTIHLFKVDLDGDRLYMSKTVDGHDLLRRGVSYRDDVVKAELCTLGILFSSDPLKLLVPPDAIDQSVADPFGRSMLIRFLLDTHLADVAYTPFPSPPSTTITSPHPRHSSLRGQSTKSQQNTTTHAHSAIMCQFPTFNHLIHHFPCPNNNPKVHKLIDIDPQSMRLLINFLYLNQIEGPGYTGIVDWRRIFQLAHRFKISRLVELSLSKLCKDMRMETVLPTLFGWAYQHQDYENRLLEFLLQHLDDVFWPTLKESLEPYRDHREFERVCGKLEAMKMIAKRRRQGYCVKLESLGGKYDLAGRPQFFAILPNSSQSSATIAAALGVVPDGFDATVPAAALEVLPEVSPRCCTLNDEMAAALSMFHGLKSLILEQSDLDDSKVSHFGFSRLLDEMPLLECLSLTGMDIGDDSHWGTWASMDVGSGSSGVGLGEVEYSRLKWAEPNSRITPLSHNANQPYTDDILDEQDTAELFENLPGFVPDDDDVNGQDTEAGVKKEEPTLSTVYEHEPVALSTLKTRLAGHAPWLEDSIPYPLVPSNHYSPRGQTFGYSPKVFYYSERAYKDWIEVDGVNHLFHWVNESHREIPLASNSRYVLTETWQCHFAGKPELKLEKLRASGGAVGLDSTHKICSGSAELYTIIVQNPHTLRGIPVAFLLTEDKTAESLQEWLVSVEAYAGISFSYITTDDSNVEYKTIKQGLGDHVCIHLCLWHIARAWNTQIKSRVKHDNPVKRQQLQAEARKAMHNIMYQSDLRTARQMIVDFRLFCQEHSNLLLEYMENNYFTKDRRLLWMKSYRQDVYYGAMDTNNYVESWHNQLKANHLKNHYRARPDRILYILTTSVLEVFKKKEFGAITQVGRKTKGQILDVLRRKDVEAMSDETIEKHVRFIDGRCTVLSVTNFTLFHEVLLAVNLIQGCTCEYFLRFHRLCKHMLMAVRKFSILRLPFNNHFCAPSILGTAATATLMHTVTEETKADEGCETK
ncbi:hypothetical protein BGZ47_002106 [Haplosporangium gracile]|nr:hypothetical protein BGZ47_002106 [Haplosporangium gracile]